jgi:hypothetical protein
MADSTLSRIQGQGGILKTSTEEVSNLAGNAGLQAAPTDAMNTGALGGNADQQKMAGTPNQVANALKLSLRPSETLAHAERVESGRTTAMGEAGRELPESLKQLAGLGGKIGAAIGQAVAGAGPKVEINQAAISALPVDKQEGVKTAAANFNTVISNPASKPSDKIKALNDLTALVPGGAPEVAKLFGTDPAAWVKSIQENPAFNDVTLKDLNASGGAVDTGSILSALQQIDPSLTMEGLEKLGWGEVKSRVNNYLGSRYMDVDNLTRQAQDLTLPSNARNEAVKRLRQLGVAGVTQAAEQATSLRDAIEQGDNITFNGQEMELGELLDDDFISQTLKGVMEDPAMLGQLKGTPFEGLIDQVGKYSTELAEKYGVDPAKASALQNVIAERKANLDGVNKVVSGLGFAGDVSSLSKDVRDALGITEAVVNGEAPMGSLSTLGTYLQGLPKDQQAALTGKLLGNTSVQIKDLEGALAGKAFASGEEMTKFLQKYDDASKLFSGLLTDFNGDGKQDATDLTGNLSKMLGLPTEEVARMNFADELGFDLPDWLDANGDNRADDAAQVSDRLSKMTPAQRTEAMSFDSADFGAKLGNYNREKAEYSKLTPEEDAILAQAGAGVQGKYVKDSAGLIDKARQGLAGGTTILATQGVELLTKQRNELQGNIATMDDKIKRLQEQRAGLGFAGRQAIDARIASLQKARSDMAAAQGELTRAEESIKAEVSAYHKRTPNQRQGMQGLPEPLAGKAPEPIKDRTPSFLDKIKESLNPVSVAKTAATTPISGAKDAIKDLTTSAKLTKEATTLNPVEAPKKAAKTTVKTVKKAAKKIKSWFS